MHDRVEQIYRDESRHVLATLIRLLGDFDLAEEAMQEAFAAALAQWPRDGVPQNPRPWLVSTGRFKATDQLRRRARHDAHLAELAVGIDTSTPPVDPTDAEAIGDDRLRLIFTCCHPALGREARLALTLREVCGLATEEVARAFLCRPTAIAQRIVRAKAKIRDARIPYEVPGPHELPARLDAVLQVVYLVFNEGYAASTGKAAIRHDLAHAARADLARRLGRPQEAPMDTKLNPTQDADADADADAAAEVRSLIEQYADAARRFDLAWFAKRYAADIRAFDAILRLEIRGRDVYLEHWRQCLEMCPGPMIFEMHDLQVEAAGNLAVGHGLSRCGAVGPDGKEQSGWMRFTSVWIRGDDGWHIAHEHFSAPFDPQTMQILNDARP